MTRIVLIIYSLTVFILSSCTEAPSEKYFEKTLVNAFKHQDFGEFRKIIITPEDLESGLASNSKTSADGKGLIEEFKKNT